MALASLPEYVGHVEVYREFNALFFGLAPAVLAERLVGDLERAGAVRRESGNVMPT